jgi:hypothetical protein
VKTCSKCGVAKSLTSFSKQSKRKDGLDGWCKACKSACERKRHEDPVLRQRRIDRSNAWSRANPERESATRRRKRLSRYGLTVAEYDALNKAQGGVCAICKLPALNLPNLPVDHDHTTGRVRGLLCVGCNRGLGMFKDDVRLLLNAAKYLGHASD